MKKTIAFALLLCLVVALTLGIGAASTNPTNISAQIRPDYEIIIDNTERTFYNADGAQVYPIVYEGTTYLPLRAIAEIMGKLVNWNESTKTVTLYGVRTEAATTGTAGDGKVSSVSASLRPDFTIIIDDVTRTFKDANGATVYPLLYQGSTYLPVRAIGEIMGKTVGWNAAQKRVTISGSSTVTDADSFDNGTTTTQPATGDIGVEKAKQIALNHAGLKASDVTFIRANLDYEYGQRVYDVEFYSGNREYDYEINAATGAIVGYDYDVEQYTPNQPSGDIGLEKAKQIALNHAGLKASSVIFVQGKLDYDDGRRVYEVEFYTSNKEYDYEIDAATGSILSYDYEAENYTAPSTSVSVTEARAKEIALAKVPGATTANIYEFKLDRDDGRMVYEGEIWYNGWEYEFEIDASTGSIIGWDIDR